MSIAGIAASSFFSGAIAQSAHTKVQQGQQDFQQLGQDLQAAGNLERAQADFAALRQDLQPGTGLTTHPHRHPRYAEDPSANTNGIAQVFSQLGRALQSSNISAAQQSYATLLQEFQQAGGGTGLVGPVAGSSGAVSLSA